MCFGGGGSSGDGGAAAQARKDEADRQARIAQGTEAINTAFAGFDPAFYEARGQAYNDYAAPQLDDQYKEAQQNLLYALSRSGNLSSSIAADRRADVSKQYNEGLSTIANKALALENQTRADVEANRNSLISELNMSANPTTAASQATNQAGLLSADTGFDPLAQMFQNITSGLATATSNYNNGYAGASNLFTNNSKSSNNIVRT